MECAFCLDATTEFGVSGCICQVCYKCAKEAADIASISEYTCLKCGFLIPPQEDIQKYLRIIPMDYINKLHDKIKDGQKVLSLLHNHVNQLYGELYKLVKASTSITGLTASMYTYQIQWYKERILLYNQHIKYNQNMLSHIISSCIFALDDTFITTSSFKTLTWINNNTVIKKGVLSFDRIGSGKVNTINDVNDTVYITSDTGEVFKWTDDTVELSDNNTAANKQLDQPPSGIFTIVDNEYKVVTDKLTCTNTVFDPITKTIKRITDDSIVLNLSEHLKENTFVYVANDCYYFLTRTGLIPHWDYQKDDSILFVCKDDYVKLEIRGRDTFLPSNIGLHLVIFDNYIMFIDNAFYFILININYNGYITISPKNRYKHIIIYKQSIITLGQTVEVSTVDDFFVKVAALD